MISFTVANALFLVVQTKAGFYQKRLEKAKVAGKLRSVLIDCSFLYVTFVFSEMSKCGDFKE
jgi:hypothetical protein